MNTIFQDWEVNNGNIKGQIVLLLFRIASKLSALPKPVRWIGYPYAAIYRVVVEWILCIEIPWKLKLGPETRLFHGQGLVINDSAIIGRNCILRHNTTIGVANTSLDFKGSAPVIEDNVDIGAGAIILGAIRIGSGARIAAGSVVIKDVPRDSTVGGNPAKLISIRSSTLEALSE